LFKMIVIVDYGAGNLLSIKNMLRRIGADAVITSDASVVGSAEKLILPGVGAFDYAMSSLDELGLIDALNRRVLQDKVPVLGLCLGVQLLTRKSEEGKLPGLGWIAADTVRFRVEDSGLKIPHMGWREVCFAKPSVLTKGMDEETRFYFVHSYHLKCDDRQDVLLTAGYGYEFECAVEKGNIAGVQFHPEKSHRFGMALLKNFVESF
jgi:imidazole glycerol-phosphate synthase subunit HisH